MTTAENEAADGNGSDGDEEDGSGADGGPFDVTIRVGRVVSAERFPEARKPELFRLEVDLGDRTVRSAAQPGYHHEPEEVVGRQVLCAVNLGTVNVAGFVSSRSDEQSPRRVSTGTIHDSRPSCQSDAAPNWRARRIYDFPEITRFLCHMQRGSSGRGCWRRSSTSS
jgi:hypothetical protein